MSDADLTNLADVPAITVVNAGLDTLSLPASDKVTELKVSGNNLKDIDLTKYPNLRYLAVNSNQLSSIDLSPCANLQVAYIANNQISSVTINNPLLWNLDAGTNRLTSLSLQGAPAMYQLWVNGNRLSTLDVTPCTDLHVLNVQGNRMKFSTLPPSDGVYASNYSYALQDSIEVTCDNGKVDLSSEASVNGTPTTFRWFVGKPETDENNELQGEELIADDEYTIDNGVTTFKLTDTFDNLVCIMTNDRFPKLVQRTAYVKFAPSAGISTTNEAGSPLISVDNGKVSIHAADQKQAYVYSVDGQLIAKVRLVNGEASIRLKPAVYVVSVANKAGKIIVR